jgi:hypothetical protein
MRKYRIGIGFDKKAEEELNNLKEFMDKYSPFEKIELETCPLSLVVSTDKYAYLSTSDMANNINSLMRSLNYPVSKVLVFDYN